MKTASSDASKRIRGRVALGGQVGMTFGRRRPEGREHGLAICTRTDDRVDSDDRGSSLPR